MLWLGLLLSLMDEVGQRWNQGYTVEVGQRENQGYTVESRGLKRTSEFRIELPIF